MDYTSTAPYHSAFILATSIYLGIAAYFWQSVLSKPRSRWKTDTIVLMVIVTVLGFLWLFSAFVEGTYLERHLGTFIPEQFHNQLGGMLLIIAIWCVLMAIATKGRLRLYCSVYLVYVIAASLVSQPILNRTIIDVTDAAQAQESISEATAAAIITYYNGTHWVYVTLESLALSALALALAYLWHRRESTLQRHFWRSPHLALGIELLLSQSLIWYNRFELYGRL